MVKRKECSLSLIIRGMKSHNEISPHTNKNGLLSSPETAIASGDMMKKALSHSLLKRLMLGSVSMEKSFHMI